MAEENLGTAVLSIVVDSKGLEESLNKAKQQIQKTSQELQRSLTAAPVNPVTGKTYAQERALKSALAVSQELLATDLKREQVLRRIGQRIVEAAKVSQGGFGEFSATVGRDPIDKAIRRNQEKLVREATAQGGALEKSLSVSKELLDTDLKREQALRRISQRILEAAKVSQGGFGEFSAGLGGDPVSKSIRRNQEKRDRAEQRRLEQLDKLDADLVRVRQDRVDTERKASAARKARDKKQAFETQYDAKQARQAEAASRQRRSDLGGRISSGLIGGAFPLLFGQGPGAALGGLVGGVAGGGAFGFGASLVGTGLGASFDALIARSKELAEALRDPIAAFDQLKTSSALSSKGLETYIEALIKSGQTAQAEQLIRADLTKNLNPTLAAALSQANDELGRSFSDVQEKLAALTAGPAVAFLQWLDEIIDRLPIQGPGGAEPGQLPTAEQGRGMVTRGTLGQLAGIGLIAAGGILGSLALPGPGSIAGAGLAATLVGAAGVGAVAGGTAGRAAGERVPEDLATQERTAATQKEIEATQARRVVLQKQLIGLTGNENSAAAQIAQGQNIVLQAQKDVLEARKKFLSLPVNASVNEEKAAYDEYKAAVAAARVEVEKLTASNNNQAKTLKRTTDVRERTTGFTSSARQGAVFEDAAAKAREEYDKAKAATASATQSELEAAQSIENKLGQAWRSAAQDLADYNAELKFTAQFETVQTDLALQGIGERIAATQALSKAERGVARETLASIQAIQAGINEAKRREQEIGAQIDIARQRGDESAAASLVKDQAVAANQTKLAIEQGALALKEAGERLASDAKNARDALRSAREGSFDLLRRQDQLALVQQARLDIQQANVFDPRKVSRLNERELISAASSARGITQAAKDVSDIESAYNNISTTSIDLSGNLSSYSASVDKLAVVTQQLADKTWAVNVAVQGAQAAAYGDVVNGALSA